VEATRTRPTGMAAFVVVWLGQVVSLLGTAMSTFGLSLWAYKATGLATPLAMIGVFYVTPQVVLGPFVGVLVDRGNRKLMMMVSDLGAALSTALILALYTSGSLQVWHLYITATLAGTLQGFQWPAYSAAISLMLPKEQYTRANGMLDMAGSGSQIVAPLLAGALLAPIGLAGILILDLVSAAVAIGTLLFVDVPQPPRTEAGRQGAGHFLKEAIYGFRYILARPSLLGLQTLFLAGNLFNGMSWAVFAPMILARSGNNELTLASVQSAGAVGSLAGGLVMSAWGGPRRRIHGVLLGWSLSGLLGVGVLGMGQSVPVWMAGCFLWGLFGPLIGGCNQAIWQVKVTPDVQGRVFTARQFIAWMAMPVGQAAAGPLADRLLEPTMAEGNGLSPILGRLVGTGAGAGMALLLVASGLLVAFTGLSGYLVPIVREAEDLLPDHDAALTGAW
jgi:DHA3 family macrolide efflux protein-like MFS transporter